MLDRSKLNSNRRIKMEISRFWVDEIGRELTPEEMMAYTENSPVRQILLDMRLQKLDAFLARHSPVEIGAMLNPFYVAYGFRDFEGLAIDPIYRVKPLQNSSYRIISGTVEENLHEVVDWTARHKPAILIMENVVNYLAREVFISLLNIFGFNGVIIGNNFEAFWGKPHPERVKDVATLESIIAAAQYKPLENDMLFKTSRVLCGVFVRDFEI